MRIIDVACAASFALTSMLVLLAVNPGAMRQQAQNTIADSRAADLVQDFLGRYDLHFLASSDASSICASAKSLSNQSSQILVHVDGKPCPGVDHLEIYDGSSKTTLDLDGRMVTIEAWVREKP